MSEQLSPYAEIDSGPRPDIALVYASGLFKTLSQRAFEGSDSIGDTFSLDTTLPDLTNVANITNETVAYTGLGENLTRRDLKLTALRTHQALDTGIHGTVIVHSTEHMEQTTRLLQRSFGSYLAQRGQKIVLTGAAIPEDDPQTDTWDNLSLACSAISTTMPGGVYVAFHNRIIPADKAIKEMYQGDTVEFVSEDDADRQEREVAIARAQWKIVGKLEEHFHKYEADSGHIICYPVNVLRDNHDKLRTFIQSRARFPSRKTRAVLFTLYSSGTAHVRDYDKSVAILATNLFNEHGIQSFAVTENGQPIDFDTSSTGQALKNAGIIPLNGISEELAAIKLKLLDPNLPHTTFLDQMLENMLGEYNVLSV